MIIFLKHLVETRKYLWTKAKLTQQEYQWNEFFFCLNYAEVDFHHYQNWKHWAFHICQTLRKLETVHFKIYLHWDISIVNTTFTYTKFMHMRLQNQEMNRKFVLNGLQYKLSVENISPFILTNIFNIIMTHNFTVNPIKQQFNITGSRITWTLGWNRRNWYSFESF